MKRILHLAIAVLLALAPAAGAWPLFTCCNKGIHCIEPPQYCPDCSEPQGHHFCWARPEHTQKLIDQLYHAECCCDRIKAAEKLGCCLHGDYHCDPEVLTALIGALGCDTCWEVRKAAAWSITYQNARTKDGVMALYLAVKLDPHYLVRDAAKDALDVLTVGRRECYKDLYASVDAQASKLKPYYHPTSGQCVHFEECGCGFTIYVCKKPEEPKPPKKEECLVPINIVVGECPAGGACPCHASPVPPPGPVPEHIPFQPGQPGELPPLKK